MNENDDGKKLNERKIEAMNTRTGEQTDEGKN